MVTFTGRPGDWEDEGPGVAWLLETLDRLAPEREMPAGTTWQIRIGVREASGTTGLRLQQTGYRVTAVHAAGRPYGLTCFVGAEDVVEEELRPTVEMILSLWLDRLSVQDPESDRD